MGEARDVMNRATEAYFGGDLEGAKALYSTDAVGVAPDGVEFKGGQEIVEYMAAFFRAFPDAAYESLGKWESGNVAIDEGVFRGTNTAPMQTPTGQTIPATGKRVEVRGCDVVTVEHGAIARHHFYFDQMTMLAQLGLVPPPA